MRKIIGVVYRFEDGRCICEVQQSSKSKFKIKGTSPNNGDAMSGVFGVCFDEILKQTSKEE